LGNALKFSQKVKLPQERKVDLKFAITDTGIGIAEDKLEYILKTFNKQPSSRIFGGTGLGLGISKQLRETRRNYFGNK
jgi:signal transduction histidine kinase